MPLNVNELVIDRVRYVVAHDIETHEKLFMLTELEEPSLNCTAEGEDVTDAVGSLITTMYRSKQVEFTATNSLFSLDLAAKQLGANKQVASDTDKIIDYTYEFITIPAAATEVSLAHKPVEASVKYIYAVENKSAGKSYKVGSTVSATEFVLDNTGTVGKIQLPTGMTGKIYVEYQYESDSAVRIVNKASEFPEACEAVVYAIFRDPCNTNRVYAGKIIFPNCKLDPSSVELALTATGKHPFTFKAFKDYCSMDEELYEIIVSE